MRRWDRLQDSYMEEYRARGLSPETVACTESRLDRWGRWLKKRRPRVVIEQIGAEVITHYIATCTSFRSKATVYGTLSTMRGFGDYLVRQGLWKINPLRWMKGPKLTPYSRLPKRIDHAHMEALWRAAANRGGDYSSHLWVTILAMLYGTGLRRGELARLNLDAFDRNEGALHIDGRKTGRERCVPLPEMVLRCLEAYLPLRHNQLEKVGLVQETTLLVSRYGQRLSGSAISNGIHDIANLAQVPVHSLHQFRHSCASDLLEAGVHLAEVQRILGHSVISTTVRYVHIADPQRRAAIALHPINAERIFETLIGPGGIPVERHCERANADFSHPSTLWRSWRQIAAEVAQENDPRKRNELATGASAGGGKRKVPSRDSVSARQ